VAVISFTKLYFCAAVSAMIVAKAAASLYLLPHVSQKQVFAAENSLLMWSLELALCWVIGLSIYYLLDSACHVIENGRKS